MWGCSVGQGPSTFSIEDPEMAEICDNAKSSLALE